MHCPSWLASSFCLMVLYLTGMPCNSVAVAQVVPEEKPAAKETVLKLESTSLIPAVPIRKVPQNEYSGIAYSVAFSPDSQKIAASWGDGTIRVWDVATHINIATYDTPTAQGVPDEKIYIKSIAFSPDGKTLAAATDGSVSSGSIRFWDLANSKIVANFKEPSGVYWVSYSPDGKTIAAGNQDNVLRIWDIDSGKIVNKFQAEDGDCGYCVVFSPDGKTLASAGELGNITLWDIAKGEKKVRFNAVKLDRGGVNSLVYSPDGKTLGAAGGKDGGGMLWDVATATNIAKFKPDRIYSVVKGNPNDMTIRVAFSPDGQTFAQGCYNGFIALWDLKTRTMTAALYGHTDIVRSLNFSRDGNYLVSASSDGTVRLWTLKKP